MSDSATEIKARYATVEREMDGFGRSIGVKRPRPSQMLKIAELTDVKTNEDRAVFNIAAAVCEIDGKPIPFPKTRAELDSMVDLLDSEGMSAAATAMSRILGVTSEEDTIDQAKKSPQTQETSGQPG